MQNLPLTNIFNDGRELTLFYRIDKTLSIMKVKTFLPYYFNPSSTGVFRGYFGGKYNKIICREPYQLIKERIKESAEADVIYTKRYMIDCVNITKTNLRYVFWDIETQSKDLPDPLIAPDKITCITTWDNYTDVYKTFWAKEFATEQELIQEFIKYLQDIKPDLILGWNALGFDYPYLCKRCTDFAEKISPIHQVVKRNNFPAGIAIIDYMDWMKKIYKYKKYSLEYVYCDEFKLPYKPQKYSFDLVTDDIKDKNCADVRKMVELERKLKLIPYFDELRRLSKVVWEDLCMYSILVDGFILQIAKEKGYILPTKPDEEEKLRREEDDIVGGYVYCKPGLFENVHLFDVGGTYPNLIRTFNLDPMNIRKEANIQTTTIRNVHIAQNANAIIPTICSKLIASRKEIQNQMEKVTGDEYELLKKKDEAHKSLNNSVYGITLFKSSRLYNKDIAGTITFLARFLIRYTKWYLNHVGYEVIASDTDSIFVKDISGKFDEHVIQDSMNNIIIPRFLGRFGKKEGTLQFKFEGTYQSLLMLVKKHYKGILTKPNGEIKEINKGIEAVRSDSSKFMEHFQTDLINRILNKETKEIVISWIRNEIERFKTLPLTEIAFPVKLSKPIESYKTDSIHVRALRYAQKIHPEWQVRIGQDFYYCYVISREVEVRNMQRKVKGEFKEVEIKTDCNVMAFDEFSKDDFEVDYTEMLERNIYMKVEAIFSALGWDMTLIRDTKELITKTEVNLTKTKCLPEGNVLPKVDIIKNETFNQPIIYCETGLGKLYNCDCRTLLKSLPDDSIDMIFTSPPYNTGGIGKNKGMYKTYDDNLSDEQYYTLLSEMLTQSLRICKGPIFINLNYMSNNKKVLYRLLNDFSDYLRENIIWKKDRVQPPIGNILGKRYEYIFLFTKDPKFQINNFRENKANNYKEAFGSWISNLIEVSIKTDQTKYSKINRAGFPIDLPKMFIDIYTNENDVILDPFMGMGTTALAAEQLKRKWLGSELLEHSCEIIKERLVDTTSKITKIITQQPISNESKKNVLVVEPSYPIKYPNLALMKLSAKHKQLGDTVRYIHGEERHYKVDIIYISTLFTYYAQQTIECINFYKTNYPKAQIEVGGILATLMPDYIKENTGITPFVGYSKELDRIKPDYNLMSSIIEDSPYIEKWEDFSILFSSRGCPRSCGFCAVKKLEPIVDIVENWKDLIDLNKKNVMFQDNNLTATPIEHFKDIMDFTKQNKLSLCFNNGFDCRIITDEQLSLLAQQKWYPGGLRFAFDNMSEDVYIQSTIKKLLDLGVPKGAFLIFTMFNFTDDLDEAMYRHSESLKLGVRPYPQVYRPLDCMDKRESYISSKWTKELINQFRKYWLFAGNYKYKTWEDFLKEEQNNKPSSIDIEDKK